MRLWLLVVVLAGAAACTPTAPVRFYTLAPTVEPAGIASAERPVIGLAPVIVPDYLNRPEIVSREGATRLVVSDLERWGEPLSALVSRVLREDLVRRTGSQSVLLLPDRRDPELDWLVETELIAFEAEEGGPVLLDARWRLFDRDGRRLVRTQQERISTEVDHARGRAGVVEAMNEAVGELAERIAAGLLQPPRPR